MVAVVPQPRGSSQQHVARGRQLVVVGDSKQLPPTNFFSRVEDAEDEVPADDEIEELESIRELKK